MLKLHMDVVKTPGVNLYQGKEQPKKGKSKPKDGKKRMQHVMCAAAKIICPQNAQVDCYQKNKTSYPNHESKAVLDAFDPYQDLVLNDLNVQGGAPSWYTGWPKEQEINHSLWHRPMMRNTTVGEKKQPFFDKLWVLDGGDLLDNGNSPLAFTWPGKAFSKTDPVKVLKLENVVDKRRARSGSIQTVRNGGHH